MPFSYGWDMQPLSSVRQRARPGLTHMHLLLRRRRRRLLLLSLLLLLLLLLVLFLLLMFVGRGVE